MKPTAIVYTSNTGYTAQYAFLLGEKTGLPVYSLEEAGKQIPDGSTVIYLGWLMAGQVKGYAKAAKKYPISAVCGVGMAVTGSQLEDVRKTNAIPESIPVFTLQGGFDMRRLKGIYKLMMTVMTKTAGKALAEKENRTPEESDMLELMLHGGNRVCQENLREILLWYHS